VVFDLERRKSMQDNERRQHPRYDTNINIQFKVAFDITTKIDYQIIQPSRGELLPEKYSGISKNISVEGIGFQTDRKLKKGDILILDVYAPNVNEPIRMEGAVRWCQPMSREGDKPEHYETGVKISRVQGEPVDKTIYWDKLHNILWSNVLESVFSSFKESMIKRKQIS
jgi:hypothetical protein